MMISDSVTVLFRSLRRSDREVFLHYIHFHDLLYILHILDLYFLITSSLKFDLF